jgi:hypothetical protein
MQIRIKSFASILLMVYAVLKTAQHSARQLSGLNLQQCKFKRAISSVG